eukprot:m51a1_g12234 hypothetical protein (650) ;mRNA; r:84497-86795
MESSTVVCASESSVPKVDVVVLAGLCTDASDVSSTEIRRHGMLTIDGVPASIPFLREYFAQGRNTERAVENIVRPLQEKQITGAGPYLKQYLERHGFTVGLVPHCEPAQLGKLKDFIDAGCRKVVISTTFVFAAELLGMLAGFCKELAPDVQVIAGGILVYKCWKLKELIAAGTYTNGEAQEYNDVTQQLFFDMAKPFPVDQFVVSLRGEQTLVKLLDAQRSGAEWKGLDNVAYYEDGRWQINPIVEEPYEPPRMDWSAEIPPDSRCFVPIQVAQGCPFKCQFCDFWVLNPKEIRHSLDVVFANIASIPVVDGVRRVFFTDDNLFPSKKYALSFCDSLIKSGLNVRWQSFCRAASVDAEVASMMAKAGCQKVLMGIESGDLGIQKRIGKVIPKDHLVKALTCLNNAGISTFSTLTCGFPGETAETLQHSIDYLNAYPTDGPSVHEYCFFKFAAMPLSKVSFPESRKKYGLQGAWLFWKHETMDADQCSELMETIPFRIKPELTAHYPAEAYFLEDPYLKVDDIKKVILLRNKILRVREGVMEGDETELWNELEEVFVRTQGTPEKSTGSPKPSAVTYPVVQGKIEISKIMSNPLIALKIKKHKDVWAQVTNPLILGKLLKVATDPSKMESDPKIAELVRRLSDITGIGK